MRVAETAKSYALAFALLGPTVGCSNEGLVEMSWQFVDATVSRRINDACGLAGRSSGSTQSYDMRVRLTVSESTDDCRDEPEREDCVVADRLFECGRARGSIVDLPASESDYLMSVRVEIHPDGDENEAFVPSSECVAVPGPRTRRVEIGRITDLANYQFVVSAIEIGERNLNLDACRDE